MAGRIGSSEVGRMWFLKAWLETVLRRPSGPAQLLACPEFVECLLPDEQILCPQGGRCTEDTADPIASRRCLPVESEPHTVDVQRSRIRSID